MPRITAPECRRTWLERLIGLFTLILVGWTWRLWTPQSTFPQIPFAEALTRTPGEVDWILVVVLMLSSCGLLLAPQWPRMRYGLLLALALSWSGLIALDQHRLQPWAWHLLLMTVAALAGPKRSLSLMRGVVISVYFWSAVSKLDPAFVEAHGQMLLTGLMDSIGRDVRGLTDEVRRLLIWGMPAGELLVAVLLVLRQSRPAGVGLSFVLHLALLLALGPLGLGHEPPVLIWNVLFLLQNVLLFARDEGSEAVESAVTEPPRRVARPLATAVIVAAVCLPVLERTGWYDHWPSWAVYSPRQVVVQVSIDEAAKDRLPESLRPWSNGLTRFEKWSFAELGVPAYPQLRWRLAVIAALARDADLGDQISAATLVADESGRMQRVELLPSEVDIDARCRTFWLNTRPRDL